MENKSYQLRYLPIFEQDLISTVNPVAFEPYRSEKKHDYPYYRIYVKKYRIPVPSLEEQKTLLDQIKYEQSLIEPSKTLIEVFDAKIKNKIREVWGE